MFINYSYTHVYADLPGFKANEGPQTMAPSDLLITPYRPDVVVHNSEASNVALLLELTCPLDSEHHLQAARSKKQSKTVYLQLLAEFDRLQIENFL